MRTHADWSFIARRNQELSQLAVAGDLETLQKQINTEDWNENGLADFDFYVEYCRTHWGMQYSEDKPPLNLIPRTGRVLDVGFGYGFLLASLANRRPVQELYGADSSVKAIELQHERTPDATLVVADSASLPWPDNYFETLVATEIVEHLSPAHGQRTYKEMGRVATPTATLILTTRINENLGRSLMKCPDCQAVHHPAGHIRSFSKTLLLAELQMGGWQATVLDEPAGGILVQCQQIVS